MYHYYAVLHGGINYSHDMNISILFSYFYYKMFILYLDILINTMYYELLLTASLTFIVLDH